MDLTVQALKNQLIALPIGERAELASFLISSLDDGESEDPKTIEAAWDDELDRRMEGIRSGKEIGIPAGKFLEEMRRKYP